MTAIQQDSSFQSLCSSTTLHVLTNIQTGLIKHLIC